MNTLGTFVCNIQTPAQVPKPPFGNLSLFLNADDGNKLYAKNSQGNVFLVPTSGGGGGSTAYASGASYVDPSDPPVNVAPLQPIPFIILNAQGITPLPNQFQIDEAGVYEITYNVSTALLT